VSFEFILHSSAVAAAYSNSPSVTELLLSETEVRSGGDHVLIKSWVEVVVGILSFVGPLCLRLGGTDLEFVTGHTFGCFNRLEVIVNIVVSTEVWHSIIDLVTETLLLVLVLGASSGGADWIRLQLSVGLDVSLKLDGESPVMSEVGLSISEVLVGGNDITVELWSEVVVNVLSWVVPFGLGCIGSELEFVRLLGLSNSKISEVINDVSVNTEVWNSVVDLVTEWLLLMLVLGASSRRADWIGTLTDIRIELNSKSPVVTEGGLGIGQVLVGGDNITIELRSEVVIDILGWVVPFGLGSISSKSKLVRLLGLSNGERSVVINDVSVNTEVWNSVVDLVTEWLLLVLVLSAASG